MVDERTVNAWLERYVDAWQTYDRAAIMALFSGDALYRYHPWDEPVPGAAAIADSWLESPDTPSSWRAEYRSVAVDGDFAVARGVSTYVYPDGTVDRVYDNLWLLRFTPDGRCNEFTEWFMKRPSVDSEP